jgi:hypothetical protein
MFAIKPSREHRKIRLIELYLCAQEINWSCSGSTSSSASSSRSRPWTGAWAPRLHSIFSLQPRSLRQELHQGHLLPRLNYIGRRKCWFTGTDDVFPAHVPWMTRVLLPLPMSTVILELGHLANKPPVSRSSFSNVPLSV